MWLKPRNPNEIPLLKQWSHNESDSDSEGLGAETDVDLAPRYMVQTAPIDSAGKRKKMLTPQSKMNSKLKDIIDKNSKKQDTTEVHALYRSIKKQPSKDDNDLL